MHCPLNYGAILQTYGLKTYLENIGFKVNVIDYRPDYIINDQSLMYVGGEKYKKNLLTKWIYRIIKAPSKINRKRYFKTFAKRELNLTSEYKTYEEICNAQLEADFFFCGSDQIWNIVSGAHKDPSYFLEFVSNKNKRIAYAASGNLPLNDEITKITLPMINNIGHISMREDSTILSIQPYITKPIVHVCDPVFLLDSKKWRNLYKQHSKFTAKEKYILVYPMGNGGESTIEKAYHMAKSLNLPLYMISASKRKDQRVHKQFNIDPYTFLSLIDNANCLITNSFHGTSFSIIFEKNFWTCVAEGSNQRITSLLNISGLENRQLIGDIKPNITDNIDFASAKIKLSDYINNSKDFINKSIHE